MELTGHSLHPLYGLGEELMSQIETAVLASKKIEAILRDGFAACAR
jgi:hypothetical protein